MSGCCTHSGNARRTKTVAGLLERPRYSPGLILEDSDLTAAVDYTRELNRLLFRSLFGCGVVCGLTTEVEDVCGLKVTIAPGLALDACGDPIQLARPLTLEFDRDDADFGHEPGAAPRRTNFWITLCGDDKPCAPRAIVCDAEEGDGTTATTRTRALASVSLSTTRPACICSCREETATAEIDALAANLRAVGAATAETPGLPDCHAKQRAAECPEPCGCGGGCDCGGCVLLAWGHWFADPAGWVMLHRGVRRFVRPQPIVYDPAGNASAAQARQVSQANAAGGGDAGAGGGTGARAGGGGGAGGAGAGGDAGGGGAAGGADAGAGGAAGAEQPGGPA